MTHRTAFLSTLALLVACESEAPGGDDAFVPTDTGADAGVEDGGGDAGAPEPEFLGYALCVSTVSPEGAVGLVVGVDDVSEGLLTLRDGVEIGTGGPTCATGFNYAFVGVGDSPIVTRFERDAEGNMVPGPRVSFVVAGVERIFSGRGRYFRFLSPERALYVDRTTGIVVVFDPTEMAVLDSVQLEGYEVEGATPSVVPPFAETEGDELLLYVRYVSELGEQLPQAALIRLNTNTLDYRVTREERCGGLANDVTTSDGTLYVASSTFVTAQRMIGLAPEAPCLLRVLPGASSFDPDFYVELSDLTGGLPTGGMIEGPGNGALIKAYDAEVVDPSGLLTTFEVVGAPSWRVFLIEDLDDVTSAEAIPDFPIQTGQGNEIFATQGRSYLLRIDVASLTSVLQDITDPFDIREGLGIRGGFFIGGGELLR